MQVNIVGSFERGYIKLLFFFSTFIGCNFGTQKKEKEKNSCKEK